jgi:hypothetical protein
MLEKYPHLSATSGGRHELCLQVEADAADAEFLNFARQNLSLLIESEERRLTTPSSLRVFARLDIGIWRNPGGSLNYFVNEVERGPSTSLWSREHSWIPARIGPAFGKSLRAWLALYFSQQSMPCGTDSQQSDGIS